MAVISGIVLAAGRSRRMGQPKALLPAAGDTFLRRAVEILRDGGCEQVLVVLRPAEEAATVETAAIARHAGARVVHNPPGELEQIDSLRNALRALPPDVEAVLVLPVDFPRIESGTVRSLITAFRQALAPVVVPALRGGHGHPVLFARAVFPELLAGPLAEGARSVVHAHRDELLEVPVDDEGILLDVDTPADLRRVMEREE